MKLALAVVESVAGSSWENVEELGTFGEHVEDTDKLRFSSRNLEGDSNYVTVFIDEIGAEKPKMICCSKRLSKNVRKAIFTHKSTKASVLGMLLSLNVIKNDKGTYIIPKGTTTEGISKADLVKDQLPSYEEFMSAIGF